MWVLVPLTPSEGQSPFFLRCKAQYKVGRRDADILVEDKSISRLHAVLHVGPHSVQLNDRSSRPTLAVEDKSKYGTKLDGTKLETGASCPVREASVILFGLLSHSYRVSWFDFRLSVCGLSEQSSGALLAKAAIAGAYATDSLEGCTHFVVELAEITPRLLLVLALGIPVVSLEFPTALASLASPSTPLPDPAGFIASCGSPQLSRDQLKVNSSRRTLFRGLKFAFFESELLAIFSPAIRAAQGACQFVCELLGEAAVSRCQGMLVVVPVGYTAMTKYRHLSSGRVAIVTTEDITQAILQASIAHFPTLDPPILPPVAAPVVLTQPSTLCSASAPPPSLPGNTVAVVYSQASAGGGCPSLDSAAGPRPTPRVTTAMMGAAATTTTTCAAVARQTVQGKTVDQLPKEKRVCGATGEQNRAAPISVPEADAEEVVEGEDPGPLPLLQVHLVPMLQGDLAPAAKELQCFRRWASRPCGAMGTKKFVKQRLQVMPQRPIPLCDASEIFYSSEKAAQLLTILRPEPTGASEEDALPALLPPAPARA
eukprot:RCo037895